MICTKFTRGKKGVNFPTIWDFPWFLPGPKTQVFCNLSFGCGSCRSNLEEWCQNRSLKTFARKMLAFFLFKVCPRHFCTHQCRYWKIKSFQKIWTRLFLNTPSSFPSLGFAFPHQFYPFFLGGVGVEVSSSLCLFAYCRLVMAVLCFIPSFTRTRKFDAPGENDGLWEPRTLALLLFVCVVDAAYMLSMYQVPLAIKNKNVSKK